MENFGYKSDLQDTTNSISRSYSQTNDDEFEEGEFLNEILTLFQQNDNPSSIIKGIHELNENSNFFDSESFTSIFIQSNAINYLIDFIQSNFLDFSKKIEIIGIFNNAIDFYDDKECESIFNPDEETNLIKNIYDLMQMYFPSSEKDKEIIECLQTILNFLTKLSGKTIVLRDSLLENYPNASTDKTIPFQQLSEIIKALSDLEINSLQISYINFFTSLCFYEFDLEMTQIVYNEYVIKLFEHVNIDSWEYLLKILRYFTYNGYGQIVGEKDQTYHILIESIIHGNSKAANNGLKILGMLVDSGFDVFSHLDIPYLCQNITNPDIKISIGIMNLIDVIIDPFQINIEKESENEEEIKKHEEIEASSSFYSIDPLNFFYKNNLLSQLRNILIDGSYKQKLSSLSAIYAIFRRKQTNSSLQDISIKVVKENLIRPIIETLEINDNNISKIVCNILLTIFDFCLNDDDFIACFLFQINEYGENLLIELSKNLNETDEDEFKHQVQVILDNISKYKNKEEIISLIYSKNDENETFATNDDEQENEGIPFNQNTRKRGQINAISSLLL